MTEENIEPAQEENQEGQEAVLFTFTNDKSERNLGELQGLLKMVYHTVLTNRLGIMHAKNTETGEVEIVLVGITQNGDNISCYPMFAPLRAEDVAKYAAPDGKGGWLESKEEE